MKIDVYEVDSAIPIPETKKNIPLSSLKVGESFLFPLSRRPSIQSLASRIKTREGKEFTIKKETANTARIWRIK